MKAPNRTSKCRMLASSRRSKAGPSTAAVPWRADPALKARFRRLLNFDGRPERTIRPLTEDILTDGLANHGRTSLDDLVRMMFRDEVAIREFSGFQKDGAARDVHGRGVPRADVVGTGSALASRHPVQVFFIGLGNDAEMEIGRVLAEAAGADFQEVTEADLANVLAEFGKYF